MSRDIINATEGINEPSELRKAIKETDRSVDIKDLQQRKLIKGMIIITIILLKMGNCPTVKML